MTVTINDDRNEYTATASQTIFNYTFRIYESTDLNVYQTAAGADFDDSADLITAYTVSGVGDTAGGSIRLDTGAASGDRITIVSNVPSSRTTDYQVSGDFIPTTVNEDFDRTVSLQKQAEGLARRSLLFPQSQQNATSLSLPTPIAGKFVKWNATTTGLENHTFSATGIQTDVSVSTYGDLRALTSASYSDGQIISVTNDGIQGFFKVKTGTVTDDAGTKIVFTDDSNRYAERLIDGAVQALWFGCAFDGATDDTAELQNFLTYISTNKLLGEMPAGTANVNAALTIGSNTLLRGQGYGVTKIVGASWLDTNNYRVMTMDRTTGPHVNVHLSHFTVQSADASYTRKGSALHLEHVTNFSIQFVEAIDGSDACIRVEGYNENTFDADPTSSHHGNSGDGIISNCITTNGYLGIELEGQVYNVGIIHNKCSGANQHNIRLPGCYNVSVERNTLTNAPRGIWMADVKQITIENNDITATSLGISLSGYDRTTYPTAISQDVKLLNNRFYGTSVAAISDTLFGSTSRYIDDLIIENNNVFITTPTDPVVTVQNCKSFLISGNKFGTGNVEVFQGQSTGILRNNKCKLRFNPTYSKLLSKGGDDVLVSGNIDPDNLRATRPAINFAPLGSTDSGAAPTTGTHQRGEYIFNGAPAVGNPAIFLNSADGTPGTWLVSGIAMQSKTAAEIGSASDAINTTGKNQGVLVFDSTNGLVYAAAGSGTTAAWNYIGGGAAITPS